ncbi:MAG TPA: permease [bacterium]|nr:permease [bacterium]
MTQLTLALDGLWRRAPRVDRALLALAALLAALAILAPAQFGPSVGFTLRSLMEIAPYLLVSVALAAWLKAAGAESAIARAFAGSPYKMILAASLVGALSPFCSCGVIPLVAALLAMGVPLAPVMAFWLSSPLMAPDMFVLTAGAIGLGFAVAKTLAAIGIGVLGGLATHALLGVGAFPVPLREEVTGGGCSCSTTAPLRNAQSLRWRFWEEPARRAQFLRATGETAWFLGKWLALAFALESLMVAWLPAETVATWLGGDSIWAIPLAVLVGVPAYLNGYAAVPVVAGLLHTGMAPGAALAFMTAGGVTSIPAAVAVWALVRRPVFGWYLVQALLGSVLVGVLYQLSLSW